MKMLLVPLALLLTGCAGQAALSLPPLPQAVACKGRVILAVGPYAGTIDCQDGFMMQQEPAK